MTMSRVCRRPGCDRAAVARLTYDVVTCQVWLDEVSERSGSTQEICALHVDRLRVPRGWMVCDRRVEQPAMFLTEPMAEPQPAVQRRPKRPKDVDDAPRLRIAEVELFEAPAERPPAEEPDEGDPPDDDAPAAPSSPLLARAFRAAGPPPALFQRGPQATDVSDPGS